MATLSAYKAGIVHKIHKSVPAQKLIAAVESMDNLETETCDKNLLFKLGIAAPPRWNPVLEDISSALTADERLGLII